MKKLTLIGGLAFALFSFVPTDASTWGIDGVHSRVGFSINHLGINDVLGFFTKYESKINSSKEDFSDAIFEFSAETASVSTGYEGLDGHLKQADMFDAAAHPKLSFKSTSVTRKDDKNYEVKGDLTLHGVTKSITLKAVKSGLVVNSHTNKSTVGFKLSGVINRKDFKVGVELPGVVASDEVTIIANTEFAKN
jgi:polyisoprenoid-binding protein YceI